jgi:hypothetical protein
VSEHGSIFTLPRRHATMLHDAVRVPTVVLRNTTALHIATQHMQHQAHRTVVIILHSLVSMRARALLSPHSRTRGKAHRELRAH